MAPINVLTLFQKIRTGIEVVDRVIEKLHDTLFSITSRELVGGQLIGPITLINGDTNVPHKLGRAVRGYVVTKLSASVTIYDKESANTQPTIYMVIHSTGAATAYFWVF